MVYELYGLSLDTIMIVEENYNKNMPKVKIIKELMIFNSED